MQFTKCRRGKNAIVLHSLVLAGLAEVHAVVGPHEPGHAVHHPVAAGVVPDRKADQRQENQQEVMIVVRL